jgi:phospholipid/cholesterol/gamma-HCH transport system substrate-binding protein
MENRANYTLVGGFVLAAMIAGVAFVFWLARFELRDERTFYYVYFRGSVAGLSEGSAVRLRGVPVGTVTAIAIDAKNVELTEVTLGIKPGTPIRTDTVASLAPQGITGLAYVNLTGGSNAAAPLLPREGKRRATIPSVPSTLDKLVESMPDMVATANAIATRASLVLSDDNVARIAQILGHVETLAAGLAAQREQIGPFVSEARIAIETMQWLALDARDSVGRLERDLGAAIGDARTLARDASRLIASAQPAMGDLRQGIQSMSRMATELETLARDAGPPIRNLGEQSLLEFSQFVAEARLLVASLNRLSMQIERDPARFLFGDQTRGFEPASREGRTK